MPHFYFHLHDGKARLEDRRGVCLPDAEAAWYEGPELPDRLPGVCLPDAEAAWYQAYRSARDFLAADGRDRRRWGGHILEVEDECGGQIWVVPLGEISELVT